MPDKVPSNGNERIELTAQLLEAVLASRANTLKPIAEMLSGFYAQLLEEKMPVRLAEQCTLKLLDGILAMNILLQKGDRPNESGRRQPTDSDEDM